MTSSHPDAKASSGDRPQARLAAQYAVLRVLTESTTLSQATSRLLQVVCEGLGWEFGAVWRVGRKANVLHCVETWRSRPDAFGDFEALTRGMTFAKGVGLPGRVWESGQPVWVEDVTKDGNFPRATMAARVGLRGAFALPMRLTDELLGVIEFFSLRIEQPDPELLATMRRVGDEVARLILRKRREDELEQLFLMSRDMLCIAGFDGYFKRLNPAWEEALGWTREELMATPYLDFVHPEDRERTLSEAGRITSGTETVEFVNRYRRRDDTYRWLAWNAVGAASHRAVFAVARDITETMRVAVELSRAKEAAEASLRARTEFLAHLSHEIRTPISAVIGMTELTLGTRLDAEQREYLTGVKGSAETLLLLINSLLDLSKLEAGKLMLDEVAFDVREVVCETVRMAAHRAHPKGVELVCRVRPDVPAVVVGDPLRLRQVLLNLVSNAIKFTSRGDVRVDVTRERDADPGFLRIGFAVTDTGIGIAEDKRRMIFEAFEQADRSTTRVYGGTGLGLSIAARLVERMGGTIEVESRLGEGSRFHFSARFSPAPAAEAAEAEPLRGLAAVIVEAHAPHREMLEEALVAWGATVKTASSLAEARRLMARRTAGALLVGVGADGGEALGWAASLHADPRRAKLQVIVMAPPPVASGRGRKGVTKLMKPVLLSDLLDALLRARGPRPRAAARRSRGAARKQTALRVLVAEDNAVNQALMRRLLERRGHRPVVVGSGIEALEALAQERFDVVLMDVRMPGMDGIEATRRARARETGDRRVPIVALTADAMLGDRERCLAAGMDGYLTKPVEPERLFETIERFAAGLPAGAAAGSKDASGAVDPVFDSAGALGWAAGNPELLREVIRMFLDDAPAMGKRIRNAVEAKDAAALREAAHALKGAASHLAAQATVDAARALERIGQEGALDQAPAALATLETEMARLTRVLESA